MNPTPDLTHAKWTKSSHSGTTGGSCVEWAPNTAATTGIVPVRDSKTPSTGPVFTTPHGWTTFVNAVANGEYPTP